MLYRQLLLIINPKSGLAQGKRFLSEIVSVFARYGYISTVCITAAQGDATRFAADLGKGMDLIVCVGGDGTLNETVQGVMQAGLTAPLGYIPAGSTNDFAASLGLSRDMVTAAEDIMLGKPKALDLGRFNGKYFTYVAAFGAFTSVCYTTPQLNKNLLGRMAYFMEGVKDLSSIRPEYIRVETENGVYEGDYVLGAVCNSTSVAGILKLPSDRVDMNDGVFEIMLIRMPETTQELNIILNAFATNHYENEMISFIRAGKATIHAPAQMNWTLDGEYECGRKLCTVENVPNAIRLMVNDNKKLRLFNIRV